MLLKVHPFIYQSVKDDALLRHSMVPDAYDVNTLLSAVDILITDYSSVFFDYLVTDKPIVFYCPDKVQYNIERGLYFEENELPGPVFERIQDVTDYIQDQQFNRYEAQYQHMKAMMTAYDNGQVTASYIDAIFFDKNEGLVMKKAKSDKKKLLLYAGGMKHNGITEALVNLCWALDESKYDITLLLGNQVDDERAHNIQKLPPYVREHYRCGYPIFTPEERYMDQIMMHQPSKEHYEAYYPQLQKAYQLETKRLLGSFYFDEAIDYSGYSYYWAKYILFANAASHDVYLHNVMAKEQEEKELHRVSLRAMFLLYPHFDRLISVTEELKASNQKGLAPYVDEKRHRAIKNFIPLHQKETKRQSEIDFYYERKEYRTHESLDIVVYNSDFEQSRPMTVTPDDHLMMMAKCVINHQIFGQLYLNELPAGWLEMEAFMHFEAIGERIVEKEVCDKAFRIAPNAKGSALIYQTGDCIELVNATGVGRLKEVVLTADTKLVTEHGTVFYNVHCGVWRGCVKDNQVMESQHQDIEVEATRALPTYSKSISCALHVNNTDATVYSSLYGLVSCKEVGTVPDNTPVLYSYWAMRNDYGLYYQFKTPTGQTGWVSARDVTAHHEFEVIESMDEACHYSITGRTVLVYPTLEAIAKRQAYQYHVHHDIVASQRVVWTSYGIFYEVESEMFKGFVKAQSIGEKVKVGYIQDIHHQWVRDFDDKHYHFITIGRLSIEKNHTALIAGFAEYFRQHSEAKETVDCYILGDGPLKEELTAQIKEAGLNDNVFLLGYKPNPNDYLARADHFIFPSKYEGQGLALIEAMMQPMPVSVHNIPVLNGVVDNGKYGYLIEDMMPETVARHLHEVAFKEHHFDVFDANRYQQQVMEDFEKTLWKTPSLWQRLRTRFKK